MERQEKYRCDIICSHSFSVVLCRTIHLNKNQSITNPSGFAIPQHRISAFVVRDTCAATNYPLSLPAKGVDMKANGTRWGWQNPRFGTSGLQIRWCGVS